MDAIISRAEEIFTLERCKYLFYVIFTMSGISKFAAASHMSKDWPRLPLWFWPIAGCWEFAINLTLWFHHELVATIFAYVYLGGVLSALISIKDFKGKTKLNQMGPGALVPPLVTLFGAIMISHHVEEPIWFVFIFVPIGYAIGVYLSTLGRHPDPRASD